MAYIVLVTSTEGRHSMGQYQFDKDQLFVPDAKQVGSIHQRAIGHDVEEG
jgi:hypothetical protein